MLTLLRTLTGEFDIRQFPWFLLSAALLLIVIGAMFITSAETHVLGLKHLVFASIGLFVLALISLLDYRHLAGISLWIYVCGLAALSLLPFFGLTVNNATRWYAFGPVNIQPSEPMKYITVLVLATYFTYRTRLDRFRDLIIPLVITLMPMLLILQQPDLGSSLLFLPLFFGLAFTAGVPFRNLFILVAVAIALGVAAWFTPGLLKHYQRQRLISFIQPESAPHSAASYNAKQATLAIAGGGWEGQGWGEGLLNQLERIPERHTDFIFPVMSEEWGFIRTAPIILFYLLIFFLMARQAWSTPDPYGQHLIAGVLVMFGFQSLLHIAISLRLSPITGLTLPLISYGGSSLISTMAGLGLVASVSIRKHLIFPDRRNIPT